MASGTSRRRRTKDKPEQAADAGPAIDDSLHLPSLSIKGFRGIQDLEIQRLARVTLLAGDNSVGKTTVLDAVRLYAASGRPEAMGDLLESREEIVETYDEDGDLAIVPNWVGLFSEDPFASLREVRVGPMSKDKDDLLEIKVAELDNDSPAGLNLTFKGKTFTVVPSELGLMRHRRRMGRGWSPRRSVRGSSTGLKCLLLGPGAPDSEEVARFWDEVALTDVEERVLSALSIVAGSLVDRVAVLGGEESGIPLFQNAARRVMVKLQNREQRAPLKSLGDGAFRLFTLALALSYCKDGFLLIDEAENGIHYSHHEAYWRMVIETAIKNNIQVLATTHSFDCIAGFSRAATHNPGNAMLVRLDREEDGQLNAATYTEDLLKIADEMGIEVR